MKALLVAFVLFCASLLQAAERLNFEAGCPAEFAPLIKEVADKEAIAAPASMEGAKHLLVPELKLLIILLPMGEEGQWYTLVAQQKNGRWERAAYSSSAICPAPWVEVGDGVLNFYDEKGEFSAELRLSPTPRWLL